MLIKCSKKRPHVMRTRGRRLSIDGTKPEKMNEERLRTMLEKALPHLVGAPLRVLVYEYWMSGQPFRRVHFDYYP